MIVVRDIFQVKFGHMKEALEFGRQMRKSFQGPPESRPRFMTDLTGQYYTLVMEGTFKDLADYEKSMRQEMPGISESYHKNFVPWIDSGRREIFTIVE